IVDNGRQILAADVALLLLAGPDGALHLAAGSGPVGAVGPPAERTGADLPAFVPPELCVGRMAAPLQRGGNTIGQLAVGSRTVRTLRLEHALTPSSTGHQ